VNLYVDENLSKLEVMTIDELAYFGGAWDDRQVLSLLDNILGCSSMATYSRYTSLPYKNTTGIEGCP
jgi:hypothetical protein